MDYATPSPESLESVNAPTIGNPPTDLRHAAAPKPVSIAAANASDDATSKAAKLKSVAAEKAQKFREFAGQKASALKESASTKATEVKRVAGEKIQQGAAKAKEAHASSEEYVRAHPTKCVLAAFGAGVLIGLLARRR